MHSNVVGQVLQNELLHLRRNVIIPFIISHSSSDPPAALPTPFIIFSRPNSGLAKVYLEGLSPFLGLSAPWARRIDRWPLRKKCCHHRDITLSHDPFTCLALSHLATLLALVNIPLNAVADTEMACSDRIIPPVRVNVEGSKTNVVLVKSVRTAIILAFEEVLSRFGSCTATLSWAIFGDMCWYF